ncbi:MAG TPA: PilN domain-containing protein [Terriglobales bacterium]|jgi:type IV pilus assembly protein PilN
MRLNINLATQPYEDARLFWRRWGGSLVALGLVTLVLLYFTVAGWLAARQDRALIDKTEQQIASRNLERSKAQATLNAPQNQATRDQSAFLNDLFERKALSWTQLFEELERVMPARLHVVSIKPEITPDKQLKIELMVAGDSRDGALELVRKMESSPRFRQTQIDSEQQSDQNSKSPQDMVQFHISALYAPAAVGSHGGAP